MHHTQQQLRHIIIIWLILLAPEQHGYYFNMSSVSIKQQLGKAQQAYCSKLAAARAHKLVCWPNTNILIKQAHY